MIEINEELKQEIKKEIIRIKSTMVNGSLELANYIDEFTLQGDNIDKFINNCIVSGLNIYDKKLKESSSK